MTLTPREKAIFERLKQRPATTDDLMKAVDDALFSVGDAPVKRPAITMSIKYLGAKIAEDGWCIVRTSMVGRGHKGEYEMRRIGAG